jgi:transposase
MDRLPYPSDLTDAQWDELSEFIPIPKAGPEQTKYSRREIVNAIMYLKRTGCPWRFLPHDFPPWSSVKKYYYQWQDEGTFVEALNTLRERVLTKAKTRPNSKTSSSSLTAKLAVDARRRSPPLHDGDRRRTSTTTVFVDRDDRRRPRR